MVQSKWRHVSDQGAAAIEGSNSCPHAAVVLQLCLSHVSSKGHGEKAAGCGSHREDDDSGGSAAPLVTGTAPPLLLQSVQRQCVTV